MMHGARGFERPGMAGLLVASLLAVMLLSERAAAQAPERLVLRLDWLASGTHIPFFLAAARGYYRAEGIDLEILDGKGSLATIQSVASGSDRIGIASLPTTATAITKGVPLLAIAGVVQKVPDAVIALKGSGITRPKDVEGKRWGIVPDASFVRTFPAFAAANGIDMNTIVKVQMSSATVFSALLQGNVDFITGWATNDALRISQQKPIEPPIVFADHGVNVLGTGVIVTSDTAAREGQLLRRFLAATVRGAEDAAASPEAGLQALMQARPATDRALLAQQVSRVHEFQTTKNSKGHAFGWMAKADWDETRDLMEKYFDLPKGLDVSRVYTNEFLPKQ